MTEQGEKEEFKDYADGWISERRGTDLPLFLKLAFPVIGVICAGYIIVQMYGDVGHATRGPLVVQMLKSTGTSPVLQWIVALLAFAFVVITAVFGFKAFKED